MSEWGSGSGTYLDGVTPSRIYLVAFVFGIIGLGMFLVDMNELFLPFTLICSVLLIIAFLMEYRNR